jgi:hypothetical protein
MATEIGFLNLLPSRPPRDLPTRRSDTSLSWGRRTFTLTRIAVLSSAVLLMLPGTWGNSVTVVEFAQLPAGLAACQRHSLGIYRVCGPVSKILYALPAHLAGIRVDYPTSFDNDIESRREWEVGRLFQSQNRERYFNLYRWSRLLPILVTVLGGCLVCEWTTRLYGPRPGLVSLCVWCWMPPVLANGSLVTSDMLSAVVLILASRCFFAFLLGPSLKSATLAGLTLGLSAATKFTLLILYPCWALLLTGRAIQTWVSGTPESSEFRRRPFRLMAFGLLVMAVSVFTVDALYLFAGIGFRLAEWPYGQSSLVRELPQLLRHRATAWTLHLPLPFPAEFLRGLDFELADTERVQSAYLLGRSRFGGWWYWYVLAAILKIPLPAMGLVGLGLFRLPNALRRFDAVAWAALCMILPASEAGFVISATTGTGTNASFRYLLPSLGLLCAWAGVAWESPSRAIRGLVIFFLTWLAIDAVGAQPDHLGWQNEMAWAWRRSTGCPALIGDNLDWGQDLARLSEWVSRHSGEGSTLLSVYGLGEAETYGLHSPVALPARERTERSAYLAVSEQALLGDILASNVIRVTGAGYLLSRAQHAALLRTRPFDRVGRTIRIYRLRDLVQQKSSNEAENK